MTPPFVGQSINTPIKRFGYVVLLVGIIILASSLVHFGIFVFRSGGWGNYLTAAFHGPQEFFGDLFGYRGRRYIPYLVGGFIIGAAGYLLSYGYDATIARLVRWIRTGH